jgi:hypothetical protein
MRSVVFLVVLMSSLSLGKALLDNAVTSTTKTKTATVQQIEELTR